MRTIKNLINLSRLVLDLICQSDIRYSRSGRLLFYWKDLKVIMDEDMIRIKSDRYRVEDHKATINNTFKLIDEPTKESIRHTLLVAEALNKGRLCQTREPVDQPKR